MTDAMRKKAARLRRQQQNAKRKRAWDGGRIKGTAALQDFYKAQQMWRAYTEANPGRFDHVAVFVFISKRPNDLKGKTYRNAGKAAVRMDRKQRQAKKWAKRFFETKIAA